METGKRVVPPRVVSCVARVLVCAVSIWLWSSAVAEADMFVVFRAASAHPGEQVEAFSGSSDGRPWRWPRLSGVRLYLVPMAHAKSPRHQRSEGRPRDPAWEPLGRLRQDRNGVARVSFTVPARAAGDYTIGFWCIPCGPPRGAVFTGAYPGTPWRDRPFTKILRIIPSRPSAASRATNVDSGLGA